MTYNRQYTTDKKGFSTLEILIAMAILVLLLSTVILVTFGNQSVLSDSQASAEALNKAQQMLEFEQALARLDFKAVNPDLATTTDGIYQKRVYATSTDLFTKRVTALITWQGDHNRPEYTSLDTIITNFTNAVGGDTCYSVPSGNWSLPAVKNTGNTSLAQIVGDPSGSYPISDIDVYQKRMYVAVQGTSQTVGPKSPTTAINKTGVGSISWSTPTGTLASGGATANASLNSTAVSNYLWVNGFGSSLAIPAGATILGIQIDFWRNASNTGSIVDNSVRLIKSNGSSLSSGDRSKVTTWSTGTTDTSYGGSSDLWGETWSPSDVNNANFGVAFSAKNTSGSTRTATVDYISVTVTYIRQLYILDVTNQASPTFINGYVATSTVSEIPAGFNAIAIATSSASSLAYVATNSSIGQLAIIDLNTNPPVATSTKQIGSTAGMGNSIFYKDGYVYLGLTHNGIGPEFNIINVTNPAAPTLVGSYTVGYSVNSIYVDGQYAYITHDGPGVSLEQLTVLDLKDPTNPVQVSGFNSYNPSSVNNTGKSLYKVGTTVYLGRLASKISGSDTIPEFYALNTSDPTNIPSTPLGSIPLNTPESLHGIIVRSNLGFFLTTSTFQVWNFNPIGSPTLSATLPLPTSGGTNTPSFDCEGNTVYASSNDASNKGSVYVISTP